MNLSKEFKRFIFRTKVQTTKFLEIFKYKRSKKKLVLFFFTSDLNEISGGVLSIRNLFEVTRNLPMFSNISVFASFVPGVKNKYYKYSTFENELVIFNLLELVNKFPRLDYLEIHIPEIYCFLFNDSNPDFKEIKEWILKVENVKINIMNQNHVLMPEIKVFNALFDITTNITMTCAHEKYATKALSDYYNVPVHLIKPCNALKPFKQISFNNKRDIILLSIDEIDSKIYQTEITKQQVFDKLKTELPEFEVIVIQNMTYDYYLDLISRAKFTITFGEGFDAYFSEPIMSGSVSFCVYNTIFFPETFKDLDTVYNSFEILIEKIVNDINNYNKNEVSYNKYSNLVKNKIEKLYSPKIFKDALEAYHLGNYDFK